MSKKRPVIDFKRVLIVALSGAILASAMYGVMWIIKSHKDTYEVSGQSMSPTLNDGQFISLDREIKDRPIEVGDLVIFENSSKVSGAPYISEPHILVKRVFALPGNRVSYSGRAFFLNGEEKFRLPQGYRCAINNGEEVVLKEGEMMVAGDNPFKSSDSLYKWCNGEDIFTYKTEGVLDYGETFVDKEEPFFNREQKGLIFKEAILKGDSQ